jgi:hypothetical protein
MPAWAAAPARVGLTVVKAARKTGRISAGMASWINRSVREVVDWSALKRARWGASIAQPAVALRAAREAVKVEKAQDLMRVVGDVGRVQAKAGTQAALDGLKLAEGPRDMSRIARLAAAKGGKTRAILSSQAAPPSRSRFGPSISRCVDILGDPDGLRLRGVAQAHDRTDHRALLCPPPQAPRPPRKTPSRGRGGALRGGVRARA